MATPAFTKEVTRFTLQLKKECLEEVLSTVTENQESDYYKHISTLVENLADELKHFEKRYKMSTKEKKSKQDKADAPPRKLSTYNKFIKKTLPEIKEKFKDMDNRARMEKASEMWKKLSQKEKDAYATMEF
jgi:peptidoglycan hydrolase CwlO-like protein